MTSRERAHQAAKIGDFFGIRVYESTAIPEGECWVFDPQKWMEYLYNRPTIHVERLLHWGVQARVTCRRRFT